MYCISTNVLKCTKYLFLYLLSQNWAKYSLRRSFLNPLCAASIHSYVGDEQWVQHVGNHTFSRVAVTCFYSHFR